MRFWKCLVVVGFAVAATACGEGVEGDDSGVFVDVMDDHDVTVLDVIGSDSVLVDSSGWQDAEFDQGVSDTTMPDLQIGVDTQPDVVFTGLYSEEPDVGNCIAGMVSDFEKQRVLDRVNYIRSLHRLPPVSYASGGDPQTAECSLVIAARRELSHTPPKTWSCWSQDAFDGCNSSNIYVQWGRNRNQFDSLSVVDAFMTDEGVATLGHRRWLIDPWLSEISFGRVDGNTFGSNTTGAAIQVIGGRQQDISDSDIEFVAYPFENYPSELFNDDVMMSLSVVADRRQKFANANQTVDFSGASIEVTGVHGTSLPVSSIAWDNDGYGVPNNLRWQVGNTGSDDAFNVSVKNVKVVGINTEFNWSFRLD